VKALAAVALTLPPTTTLLYLSGLLGLEAYITVNAAAPAAATTIYAMLSRRRARRVLGGVEACPVCRHAEKLRIEERVRAGERVDAVAREYGLGEDEVVSHVTLHAGGRADGSVRVDVETELSRILEELKAMQEELKRIEGLFESGEFRVQDYIKLLAERRALMRDIRSLLLIISKTGERGGGERDISALLRRLRGS